ncbi:MAG: ABC transporter ATP-binding protein [Hyphomicrobiaceae bacterium]
MSRPDADTVLELADVVRRYGEGERALEVLKGASASIRRGEAVALVGPSGSGKSSLLHIAGLLEAPDGGRVVIGGRDAVALSDRERTRIRRNEIGFVYQFHHLLPEFTALENVVIPQLIAGRRRSDAKVRAKELLGRLGLAERTKHQPMELSGGEQQRVAIARALANEPSLLLADEPTGNLDPPTAERVFAELMGLIRATGLAAVIATHNLEIAGRMDRVIRVEDGRLVAH